MKRLAGLVLALLALLLTGCIYLNAEETQEDQVNVSSNDETDIEETITVEEISFEESHITVEKGDEFTLKLSIYPENANTPNWIKWVSSDPKVVQVDADGNLTAIGAGTATIAAYMGEKMASCLVTVEVPLEEIELEDLVLEYDPDAVYTLDMQLLPEDTTDETEPVYESDNTDVLVVDSEGNLYTMATGTATVTVTIGEITAQCEVSVVATLQALSFEQETVSVNIGQSTTLSVQTTPTTVTEELEFYYESSAPEVVSVDQEGVITALAAGTATITVSAGEISAECTVTVGIPLEGISLGQTSLQLNSGASVQLEVSLLPSNTTESPAISYSSSDSSVATVDANGVVYAVAPGSAVISVSAQGYSASCSVSVAAPLQSISLSKTDITIYTAETATLTVSYNPSNTTADKTVTWSSSNSAVATVSGGTVTGVGAGTCTITATVGSVSASCIVRVKSTTTTSTVVSETTSSTSSTTTSSGNKVVVLDAGHGGSDPGASYNGLVEKVLNLKVALYCKAYLEENYTGVTVYLTRSTDTQLTVDSSGTDLRSRCAYAASVGADIMVSLHFNSTSSHSSSGALVLISQSSNVYSASAALGNSILAQLQALGLGNRGTVVSTSGSTDYYAINRYCASYGIPGIIVEHCFMDNASDVAYCDSDADLQKLGIADAIGIANYLGLAAK